MGLEISEGKKKEGRKRVSKKERKENETLSVDRKKNHRWNRKWESESGAGRGRAWREVG